MSPLVHLAFFPAYTLARARRLTKITDALPALTELTSAELMRAGWEEEVQASFFSWLRKNPAAQCEEQLVRAGIAALELSHVDYPYLLKQIPDAPLVVFVRGDVNKLSSSAVAIVGTRRITPYGRTATEIVTAAAVECGLVAVSGLALGVDGMVHETTLKKEGVTVAVLGGGVDDVAIYPRAHFNLGQEIIKQGGAIMSEYPPGFKPTTYSFPARNRIIAGLTRATIVTEAPLESGALLTAYAALDYNRDVLAVPHPITSSAGEGCNALIKRGAGIFRSIDDLSEAFNIERQSVGEKTSHVSLSDEEKAFIALLGTTPLHIDQIVKQAARPAAFVSTMLTMLELKGVVRHAGGMKYGRI